MAHHDVLEKTRPFPQVTWYNLAMGSQHYTHRVNARARRISLKLNQAGEVIVVSPRFTPQWLIRQFVSSQSNWISEQQQKLQKSRERLLADTHDMLLFGTPYALVVEFVSDQPPGIYVSGEHLIINPYDAAHTTATQCSQQLTRFLKKSARTYLEPKTAELAARMSVTYDKLQLREQSSRWGSCSHQGTLSLNWRLVHCPTEVIDYVVVHELAHLVHFDHSRKFWSLVEQHDAEFRSHRAWLKRHGSTILSAQLDLA